MKITKNTTKKSGTKTETVEVRTGGVAVNVTEYTCTDGDVFNVVNVHPQPTATVTARTLDDENGPVGNAIVLKVGHGVDAVTTFITVEQAENLRDALNASIEKSIFGSMSR